MQPPRLYFPEACRPFRLVLLWSAVFVLPLAVHASEGDLRTFDLPANTAEKTLKLYAEQSGRPLIMSAKAVNGIRTNALRGRFTPRDALERVLANTGLEVVEDKESGSLAVRQGPAGGSPRHGEKPPAPGSDRPHHSAKKKANQSQQTLTPMKRNRLVSALAAGVALLTAPLEAQPAPSSNSPGNPARDEPVELSPFVVQSSRDTGYVATDTVAGSRLNTPLVDTSAAIDVMTLEFLQDIGATTLEEALEYAVNADNDMNISGDDNQHFEFAASRINVRGLQATRTRNFFPIPYSADVYNIDRVEEQRGPNSILFGIGSPAGVINVNTKRALLGNSIRRTALTVNSEGGYRGTLDLNQPLNNSLAVRFNAVYSDMDDAIKHHAYRETKAAALAATWKVNDRIRLTGEFEKRRENSIVTRARPDTDRLSQWLAAPQPRYTFADWQAPGVSLAPYGIASLGTANRVAYVDNNDTLVNFRNLHTSAGTGLIMFEENRPDLWDRTVNDGGPGQVRENDSYVAGGAAEFKITPRTVLELAFNHTETDTFANMLGQTQGLRASPNQFLSDKRTPNVGAGRYYLEGAWARWFKRNEYTSYRSTLSQEVDLEKFGNYRVALMYERDDELYRSVQQREKWVDANGQGLFNSDPNNVTNHVWRRHYIMQEGDWADYHVSSPVFGLIDGMQVDTGQTAYSAWRNLNAGQAQENTYETALVALQARYFNNRLVVGVGYRHDKLEQTQFNSAHANGDPFFNEFRERVVNYENSTTNSYTGKTKTLGAVYHLTPNLRVMYNQSDNFGVPSSARRSYPDSGPADNTEGEGRDFGLGFRLWNNRVSGRITRFETDSKKIYQTGFRLSEVNDDLLSALVAARAIAQTEADTMNIEGTGGIVDQRVEGYEVSVVANLTKNWRLRGAYSFTEGFQTNTFPDQREYRDGDPNGRLGGFGGLTFFDKAAWANIPVASNQGLPADARNASTIGEYVAIWKRELAEELAVDGVTLPRNRPHKASLFSSYSFTEGALRDLTVSFGVRYQSEAELGLGIDPSGRPFALKGNEYWMATGMMGYTFRNWWKLKQIRVQLNVDNLFDFSDYIITGRNATTQEITKVTYLPPRAAKLSVSFSF